MSPQVVYRRLLSRDYDIGPTHALASIEKKALEKTEGLIAYAKQYLLSEYSLLRGNYKVT